MRILVILLLFLTTTHVAAQKKIKGTIRGKVIDSTSNQGLPAATICVINIKDTTFIIYALSNEDGSFIVQGIPSGEHNVQISFKGYQQTNEKFATSLISPDFNAGTIRLVLKPTELGNVTVKTSWVTVNGDTTEFRANYFKTKPNATAEDLLKKIPGVQVDRSGVVKARGQNVTRVLVDGKPFFGDDPKIATRNLPSDVIDKVQIIEARSDESLFKGLDYGNRQKVVNIVTKKDRRKGVFGRGSLGVGDKGIYNGIGNINVFDDDRRVSFLGEANNVNTETSQIPNVGVIEDESGFSDVGTSGMAKTKSGGFNYNDKLGANTTISGSYRYNNVRFTNNFDRLRETFVDNDSSLFNFYKALTESQNNYHKFKFELVSKHDTSSSLLLRSDLSIREKSNKNESTSITKRGGTGLLNNINSTTGFIENGFSFNNDILYRHKFAKKGRTIGLNVTTGFYSNSRSANNYSINTSARDTIDKQRNTERNGENLIANISYSEPLSPKSLLEFSYSFDYRGSLSCYKTYDLNRLIKEYIKLDSLLSNYFKNGNVINKININYSKQINANWNYIIGLGAQNSTFNSYNITQWTSLSQSFNNLFPALSFDYNRNRTKNFRFSYYGNTNTPSVSQLQDVVDKSLNVSNYIIGNPNLRQEFASHFNLMYNSFNSTTSENFLVSLTGGTISNLISNYSIINSMKDSVILRQQKDTLGPGAQLTQPVNLTGNMSFSGFINFGFPLKAVSSNINLTSRFSISRTPSLARIITKSNVNTNEVKYFTNNYIFGATIAWTMNVKDVFDMNLSSSSTYGTVNYQGQTNNIQSNSYYSQEFSFEPTYLTANNWIIATDFDYTIYRSESKGFNQLVPLWNASINKLMFKNKQGELKFTVFDLLNKNKSISRVVMDRYIEDTRAQLMKRFFLLSFTYNLRSFKGRN